MNFCLRLVVISLILLILLMVILLFKMSLPSMQEFGFGFIFSSEWNPVELRFGAWPLIFGTLVTSFLALFFALPFGIFSALFITEICPDKLKNPLSIMIDLIAAIPSIVFGMWGLFFLVPFVRDHLSPIFDGPSSGIGMLSASLILAIMIIPTISSLSREIFWSVPVTYKEAALAIGATEFEKIKYALLRPSFTGLVAAASLALARAIGETMAVVMVIGNTPQIASSLFAPGATMASLLANEYAEASDGVHMASLCYLAIILFAISMLISFLGSFLGNILGRPITK